ncbi:MAG TPA: polyphosphate kinase 1 [Syntrophales bacterium]|nr:polyphosphate kinase 1 [Syntrophales bacterium]
MIQEEASISKPKQENVNLDDPLLQLDRELSWLEFNRRVLEEVQDNTNPTLERLKFASIFSSNLDEFFMVRVGGLYRILEMDVEDIDPYLEMSQRKLNEIAEKARELVTDQYKCFVGEVMPQLERAGISILRIDELDKKESNRLEEYFEEHVFPVLTPLAVDPGHPFPYLGNLRLNLMVLFEEMVGTKRPQAYAFVEVPSILNRLVPVKGEGNGYRFILLEDLIRRYINRLFPGMKIKNTIALRLTRNQDYDLHENEVLDLLQSIEAVIKDRSNKIAVRLEIDPGAPKKIVNMILKQLGIEERFVYEINGPINISDFLPLYDLPVDAPHRDIPFNPRLPKRFTSDKDVFSIIREGDVLLHHPYDSFAVVMEFLDAAADDPNVLAIKQTLYRTGKDSPVVAALRRAAETGKQVTAIVELKARFDEKYNINWSKRMEEAGVNSVFGFVQWKTHCKATLVVRREGKQLRRYVHVSTGNYNTVTAKIYTDVGLLTCDPEFGNDVSALFNVLTGFNSWSSGDMLKTDTVASMFRIFMISPVTTQDAILRLIDREIEKSNPQKPGRIIAKMNALIDTKTIRKLYEASRAGIRIDLIVRGICCLRPGLPGISENIRVTSIVDRFLEHSRLYYFHNGGEPEIYSGSADWMPRNFKRRVEILYPIKNADLKSRIMDEILMTYLNDNVKARLMQPDGSYVRVNRKDGDKPLRSQSELIAIARKGGIKSPPYEEFVTKIGRKKRRKQ